MMIRNCVPAKLEGPLTRLCLVAALASQSCQDSHFPDITQTGSWVVGQGKLRQEGIATIRDGEEARVVYPKSYAAPPLLTFTIDRVWFKDLAFSRDDFRISTQEASSFRIENNHQERLSGAWAVIKWRAEGIRLADKPMESRTKHDQILAMVEKAGGRAIEDTRLPDRPIITIDLHRCGVTDADLELLEGLNSLRTLNLYGTRVTDAGLVHLSALGGLQSLHLTSTPITDAGLRNLERVKSLTELGLYGTRISDDGLQFLKGLGNLQKLSLGGRGITDSGLKQLTGLKNLRQLVLTKTSVTAAGLQELQQALPKLQIVR